MNAQDKPFMITGPFVLGEILRRNALRQSVASRKSKIRVVRRARELVESNLPLIGYREQWEDPDQP